ncbi:hypothetical protein ACFOEE_01800 [Pseudoalteromonas fenneropenaei]|uniref:Uncharacterized protein n=1 Tax=Pseudoalteromonas fenneropenaei TaxID=1737459 RepID=A0ABV7CFA9_9GAMM
MEVTFTPPQTSSLEPSGETVALFRFLWSLSRECNGFLHDLNVPSERVFSTAAHNVYLLLLNNNADKALRLVKLTAVDLSVLCDEMLLLSKRILAMPDLAVKQAIEYDRSQWAKQPLLAKLTGQVPDWHEKSGNRIKCSLKPAFHGQGASTLK